MHSLRSYLERRTTEELQGVLHADTFARRDHLPVETVLMICEILVKRESPKADARAAYRLFLEHYLPEELRPQDEKEA